MRRKNLLYLFVLALICFSCDSGFEQELLIGKWQPNGDDSRTLEFTAEGYYNLFVGDMNIFQDIEDYGRIKYQIIDENGTIRLNLMDETLTKDFVKGEIEMLHSDTISIAFYQNNGEVNVKEEYVRIK